MIQLFYHFCFFSLLLTTLAQSESISAKTLYPEICQQASNSEQGLLSFKSNPTYTFVLEHVTYEQGQLYLDRIIQDNPHFLNHPTLEGFRENDSLGKPTVFNYQNYGVFSPTTLRYMKVASDLRNLFGDLSNKHIVEIGAGYGGQCKILNTLGQFASYTIIDLPEVIELIKKYLDHFEVKNVNFISCFDLSSLPEDVSYDLVISNYAFSELSLDEQTHYLDKVIFHAKSGYITYNFLRDDNLSLNTLRLACKNKGIKLKIEKESPLTSKLNKLVYWTR